MGKVIWITGASSGIGEELSYQFSKKEHYLILSARNKEALQKVQKNTAFPKKTRVLPLDISDFENAGQSVQMALQLWGKIDILINNAGISQRSLIAETDFSVYRRLMDVNYLGTVALTKAMLPHFIAQNNGQFVVVSSLMGKFSSPYRSGYCGAKHALHGFFDALRMEHEKDGVNVTIVCPGFVQTDVAKNALTADGSKQKSNDAATEGGLSVSVFCKKMIRAIERRKFEVYIAGKEKKGIYVKRLFPKLLHKLVLRSQIR
jgi:short-subunit dehydrogenase